MEICLDCPVDVKLSYCCGVHPETHVSKPLVLDTGEQVWACPQLGPDALCTVYEHGRPSICSRYHCERFGETDLYTLLRGSAEDAGIDVGAVLRCGK
ncbi:hypothetical protein AUJ68_06870 [Candidatus Woesearchaeota archaeon CG1_02_57_44]|nr:MAG: hypothetical protein AUJ68_06870 [Candidatus Woesearchaeota archaeon CG1_02_57_44]PIN67675.1 MAG: hypothetical protein COV94_06880 [Candidatus Woesearchaeota archaeon CG11_big_fil_rev_8_21_14_0_20_57_5]